MSLQDYLYILYDVVVTAIGMWTLKCGTEIGLSSI